mmetsp:Transcript_38860/g.122469  ORF Transcript_38860/g.122469 Transcript_38860/m.122469 type:complete len:230 (-) Transcript_38860:2470-3159(-)
MLGAHAGWDSLGGRELGDSRMALSWDVVLVLLADADDYCLGIVPEVEQYHKTAKENVADKKTSEARRSLLDAGLVGEGQPPIVVGDLKRGACDVEVETFLDGRLVGVLDEALPLGVRGLLEQPVHGVVRHDKAAGPAVHDGREVAKTGILRSELQELNVPELERERNDDIIVDRNRGCEEHLAVDCRRVVTPELDLSFTLSLRRLLPAVRRVAVGREEREGASTEKLVP